MMIRASVALLAAATLSTAVAGAQSARLEVIAGAIVEATAPPVDDPDVLVTRLLTAARGASGSPASSVVVDMARRFARDLEEPLEAVRLLDEILGSTPHGLTAHSARLLRRDILELLGDRERAHSIPALPGFASHFVVVGPFGDSGDDYTGVPFPPEFGFPAKEAELPGRFDPVIPRIVRRKPHELQVSLREERRDRESGCFYALHQVRTTAPTSCYADLSVSGSFELFVNGDLVETAFRPSSRGPDRHFVQIRLVDGNNQILVKTTESRADRIALRYVDAVGRPVELTELTAHGPLQPGQGSLPPALSPFVDGCRVLEAAITDAERPALFAVAATIACFEADHTDRGLARLADLETSPPEDPQLQLALVAAYEMAATLPPEVRRTRSQPLFEAARTALENHHSVILRSARLLADEDQREQAIALLQQRLLQHPSEPSTHRELFEMLRDLRFTAEATRLAERWHERSPHNISAVLAVASSRDSGGDLRGALEIVEAALERLPGSTALRRRALEIASDFGDAETRDAALAALYVDQPGGLDAQRARADALLQSGESVEALDAFTRLIEHPEATADVVESAANQLATHGRAAAAVAGYARTLELDPQRHRTRRLLQKLRNEREPYPLVAQFRRDGDASRDGFEFDEARERGASSTLVLDQMIVRFYSDGSAVVETHTLRRINDLRGVEAYSEAPEAAGADEILTIRTITADGRSFVPNRVRGSYSMPRLEPGAFVEQVTRSFRSAPGALPWRAPLFLFRSPDEPYLLSELVVILPIDHPGSFRVRRFDGERERRELGDGCEAHVFRARDVPRLETERLTPPLNDLVPVVAYGEDGDFAATANAAWSRAHFATRSSPWVAAATRAALEGVEGDAARARALYDWVHAKIPGGRGRADPTTILLRNQGPRFFLWLAMLNEAEVPLRHAIVKPASEDLLGEAVPLFLGEDDFPLPAVRVEPRDGEPFWVFADNARYQPAGSIPPERLGAPAIVLGPGRHEFTRLPRGHRDGRLGWRYRGTVALDERGDARFELRADKLGDTGYVLADRIRDLPEANRGVAARQIAAQLTPGWTVIDSALEGLEPGERLRARATVGRESALQSAGDEFLLSQPMPPLELVQRLADRPSRTLELRLSDMDADDTEITIDPGAAFELVQMPQGLSVQSPMLDFSLSFRREAGTLVMSRRMSLRPGKIAPGDYPDWQRTLRAIDAAERTKIRFRPHPQ